VRCARSVRKGGGRDLLPVYLDEEDDIAE
jgi:hypothetical protein